MFTPRILWGLSDSCHGVLGAAVVALFISQLSMGCGSLPRNAETAFALQPGDLLFQDLDCGPLCNAIETVTQGIDGAHFSHVGMVSRVDGPEPKVIEAVSAGVIETPLSQFLARSADSHGHPKVLAGRVDDAHRQLVPGALAAATSFLGRPYDSVYVMDDSSFYCSELIFESFRLANRGAPIFSLAPMTFKDPMTDQTFPAWKDYYDRLGVPIPEGQPGLNPGGMSRSSAIRIVHAYGRPTGWRGDMARLETP